AGAYTTASARPSATAATTALPPRLITSTPIWHATRSVEATIPWGARTGSRHAASLVVRQTERSRRNNRFALHIVFEHIPPRVINREMPIRGVRQPLDQHRQRAALESSTLTSLYMLTHSPLL